MSISINIYCLSVFCSICIVECCTHIPRQLVVCCVVNIQMVGPDSIRSIQQYSNLPHHSPPPHLTITIVKTPDHWPCRSRRGTPQTSRYCPDPTTPSSTPRRRRTRQASTNPVPWDSRMDSGGQQIYLVSSVYLVSSI